MKQGWEIKKLGEVCDILDSQRKPVTKKDRKEGQYPYYGATGIQDYVDSYIFDGRYLLLGEDGAKWGAMDKSAFIIEGKCWVNNHAHILKVHDCLIDTFAEYYLVFKDLDEYITGAIVRKLTQQALRDIPMLVPPIAEQEKIVAELDCLSGIIEKKKQQLKELDALAQSIFYEMFGDPVENDKGWKTSPIKDVAPQQVYKGNVPCVNGKYWLLNLDVVVSNTGEVLQKCYFELSEIGNSTITFSPENVLYSKLRPYLNKVVLPNDIGYATSELIPLCPNKDFLDRVFLAHLLRSSQFVTYISNKVAGAKMPRVSMGDFRTFPVMLPPLALQQDFASKIEAIEKQKELIAQSIKETETLFNSRMNYYFN